MTASAFAPSTAAAPLRLGFIGLGWIGARRLAALAGHAGIEVAALADPDAGRLEASLRQHPQAAGAKSLDGLLEQRLDGIVIATPNAHHVEQATACLEHGVAVFCQKPLATNAKDAARVVSAARSADRLLGVDLCYRSVAGMSALREALASGTLGDISLIDLTFHNAYSPDKSWCQDARIAGGGCLLDLGVHLIDLAQWLSGFPRLELRDAQFYLRGRVCPRGQVEDTAIAHFVDERATSLRVSTSWHAHAGVEAIIEARIFGSQGGARWHNVGGSFFEFALELNRGAERQVLAAGPDEWEARTLTHWIERLRVDAAYDAAADHYVESAAAIDAAYARLGRSQNRMTRDESARWGKQGAR